MTFARTTIATTSVMAALALFLSASMVHHAHADEVGTYGGHCNNREGAGREFHQDYYVYFDSNSSRVKPEGHERIKYVYGLATGHQAQQICLFGKASKKGDAAGNAALSHKRSLNVARAFEALGWPRSKIVIVPEGEAWGWLENTLTSDSEDDRRVRIKLSQ